MFRRRNLLGPPETHWECLCSSAQLCRPLISLCLTPTTNICPPEGINHFPNRRFPFRHRKFSPFPFWANSYSSFKARLNITSFLKSPLSPESRLLTRPSKHLALTYCYVCPEIHLLEAGPLRTEVDFRHNRSSVPLTMAKRGLH